MCTQTRVNKIYFCINNAMDLNLDRLCGLVATVPGYRFRGPGSIPGATRLSEK
jgi:hypothetical protein